MLRLAGFSSGRGDCARGGLVCGAKQVCCGVFRSDHDRRAFLLECLAFDSGLPCVPVGMFFLRSRLVFAACAFPYGDPDRERRDAGTRRTESAAQDRFCVNISALPCFPRGVRWGKMRKPYCGLPGLSLFDSRRGCVSCGEGHSGITKTSQTPQYPLLPACRTHAPQHPATRKDPPESNKRRPGCMREAVWGSETQPLI